MKVGHGWFTEEEPEKTLEGRGTVLHHDCGGHTTAHICQNL